MLIILHALTCKGLVCIEVPHFAQSCVLWLGRLHSKAVRDLDETKRFICYTLDAALRSNDIKRNPEGKICSIFDLRGVFAVCQLAASLLDIQSHSVLR